MSWVLETKGLVKRFGGITATQNVNLQVAHGARHALIGPNGVGKTTLINLITGVLPPSEGNIILNGEDITQLAPHKRVGRGLVRTFQINQLFASMTPREALAMWWCRSAWAWARAGGRHWARMPRPAVAATSCWRSCICPTCRTCAPIAWPMASGACWKSRWLWPASPILVLLLDEPVAGVPTGEREELFATVSALPADVTILLIEHDMDLVFGFADRITVLVNGAVLTTGGLREIADDPQVKAVYLGHGTEVTL